MSARRMISSSLFEDDFVGTMNYFERLVWIGLFSTVADDQGRLIDSAALIRSKVFLYDSVTDSQIETAIRKIFNAGKITRYEAGCKHLIQIVKWWEYQTPAWAMPSKYLPPSGWQDRAKYHGAGNKILMKDWDKIGGYVVGYVPMQDSAIEEGEVKGNGNGDGDGNGDVDGKGNTGESDEFDIMQRLCEQLTGRFGTSGDVEAIADMVKAEVIETDIKAAISWFSENRKTIHNIAQIRNAVFYQKGKRIQAATAASAAKSEISVSSDIPISALKGKALIARMRAQNGNTT